MAVYAVGIDLGGTSIKAALVERHAGIVATVQEPTGAEQGPDHVLHQIGTVARTLQAAAPEGRVLGIGIGAPGTVDLARSTLIYPPNIHGWEEINLRSALHQMCGEHLSVVVENDANAAGLGSAHYGAGRPYASFIMVTLGTGVGGAIIVDKRVFRGTTGAAGEIGHMTIHYAGPEDKAGVAGAIEAYLGIAFLTGHARTMLEDYPHSLLFAMAGSDLAALTPRMLSEAAQEGDEAAIVILRWAGQKLGAVLGACINLLDIRVVVVGGGISGAGDYLLKSARETALHFIKPGMQKGVRVVQETLGNEAGMLGAACLVFEHADLHVSTFRGT